MEKKKREFSKTLLIQESALIWIVTLACLALSFYCIYMGYVGSLIWLSTIVTVSWTAYGVSQAFYYRKAMAENTSGGIKYETVVKEAEDVRNYYRAAVNGESYSFDDSTSDTVLYDDEEI